MSISEGEYNRDRQTDGLNLMEEFKVENWKHFISLHILVKCYAFVCMYHLFSLSGGKM